MYFLFINYKDGTVCFPAAAQASSKTLIVWASLKLQNIFFKKGKKELNVLVVSGIAM